jgi:hypothetical protein
VRLISPKASRFERISLLCVVSVCFYLVKVLYNPLYFTIIDEFLHWRSADDLARSGHLFSANSLLPVSPYYPGLEIVTNALSTLSGLSIFNAGIIVVGVARLATILSFFALFELITGSACTAGIAIVLYMADQHFLYYDTTFAYGSLAVLFLAFVLFVMAHDTLKSERLRIVFVAVIALEAITVTHHVTSFVLDGFLILWTVIYVSQRPARLRQSSLPKITLFGVLISLAWIGLKGNPVVEYLSSYANTGLDELWRVLTSTGGGHHFFVDAAGQQIPPWERVTAISSVALIVLCLPFGLLCIWVRYRHNALACMLGFASLIYPIGHIFRLTNNGAEISDRALAFFYIPVTLVLAIFITQFWPTWRRSWNRSVLITCALSVVFLGGTVLEVGPSWSYLPGPYLVAAGPRSIEPEGIQAAIWTHADLGSNNRMSTDFTNQLLMSTYGDQSIVNYDEDNIDVTPVFLSPAIGPDEVSILKRANVRYLVVDLRLSTALPILGFYFESEEPDSNDRTTPLDRAVLTKFNTVPQINRMFDSGDIVIYDVGGLINAPEKP